MNDECIVFTYMGYVAEVRYDECNDDYRGKVLSSGSWELDRFIPVRGDTMKDAEADFHKIIDSFICYLHKNQ